jgi:hypothetical protein
LCGGYRRGVGERAALAPECGVVLGECFAEAEIDETDVQTAVEKHILGLEVRVRNAAMFMRIIKRTDGSAVLESASAIDRLTEEKRRRISSARGDRGEEGGRDADESTP